MGREIQAERTRLNDARRVGRVGEYWKKVNSITVIYSRRLSFNLEPQNQVLEHLQGYKLSKPPSDLHLLAVSWAIFADVAPHQRIQRGGGSETAAH
jgi:hypothetical protein